MDRGPNLYEALDFLEKAVEPAWLVKRYRRELSGDRHNERKRINCVKRCECDARDSAQVGLLVDKMSDLAVSFRENKAEIDHLRCQLDVVRRHLSKH